MSFINIDPQAVIDAAGSLSNIGSVLDEATTAIGPVTTSISPAAIDEVSAVVSQFFGGQGANFQALASVAQVLRNGFTQNLGQSANLYAQAESSAVLDLLRDR